MTPLKLLGLVVFTGIGLTWSDTELHRKAIVIDTHSDSTDKIYRNHIDFSQRQPEMQSDLPRMKEGGLDGEFFSIWVDPDRVKAEQYYKDALDQFDGIEKMVRKQPDTIAFARSAGEVRGNAARGRISALFGVEGGHALQPGTPEEQIQHLRVFAQRGARYMTLTWSKSNGLGGSSGDDGDSQGLTDFGRHVIDEMHRLGVVVDLSHVSDPTFWDAIRYVKRPVLLSHSSARQLANHPRNASDAMLKAVAKNHGAVCVNFFPVFLDDAFAKAAIPIVAEVKKHPISEREALLKTAITKLPRVPLSKLIDHIDHIVKKAGVDHVCLGSDFDGIYSTPEGLDDVSKLPAVTRELRKRGYTDKDVEKILGGNVLRVLDANAPSDAVSQKK